MTTLISSNECVEKKRTKKLSMNVRAMADDLEAGRLVSSELSVLGGLVPRRIRRRRGGGGEEEEQEEAARTTTKKQSSSIARSCNEAGGRAGGRA